MDELLDFATTLSIMMAFNILYFNYIVSCMVFIIRLLLRHMKQKTLLCMIIHSSFSHIHISKYDDVELVTEFHSENICQNIFQH